MYRYPEHIQFKAAAGTAGSLQALAEAEGKRPADIVREAVNDRLLRAASTLDRKAA